MQRPVISGLAVMLVIGVDWSAATWLSAGTLKLGPQQIVQVGGSDLIVPGYSVPQYYDWDNDGRNDLIVGQGGGGSLGMVRIYPNVGTRSAPQLADFHYLQSQGTDLEVAANGCLGAFPQITDYDDDGKKDLLLGLADGRAQLYRNTGTDSAPELGEGQLIEVGPAGAKVPLDAGYRATLAVVDWNNDGLRDLVVGAFDSRIRLYLNEGGPGAPDFRQETVMQDANHAELLVPGDRSSPVVMDLDGDGRKDLLAGNTEGQILLYLNEGTDAEPVFSDYVYVESDGAPIDLPGSPRSRPSVTDWTGDGLLDLLVGSGDGKVRLYEGLPDRGENSLQAGDANQDLSFDQRDLLQVLRAGKYQTGQPATWGEGDWNGAPGGHPGDPPLGDGVFDRLDVVAALAAGTWLTGPYADLARADRAARTWPVGDDSFAQAAPVGVPVPEPSAAGLAAIGLLGLATLLRRL